VLRRCERRRPERLQGEAADKETAMSLNWDVSKVKDSERVTTAENGKDWHPVTFALAMSSMLVDLGSITDENVGEWMFRLHYLKRIGMQGQLVEDIDDKFVERTFTADEVRRHVGMRTNVVSTRRAEFVKRWSKYVEREATKGAERALEMPEGSDEQIKLARRVAR